MRIFTLLSMATLFVSEPAFCRFGPGSDGGGHIFTSSPAEIQQAVAGLKSTGWNVLAEASRTQMLNPKYAPDADIKRIVGKFEGCTGTSPCNVIDDLTASELVVKPTCPAGSDDDASTQFHRSAEICFSSKRLYRFPAEDLAVELTTLAMHELAHHFGLNEADAIRFQNYLRPLVRQVLAANNRNLGLHGWYEMRVHGTVVLQTSNGAATIRCVPNDRLEGIPLEDNKTADITYISPGPGIYKNTVDGPVDVYCNELPVVECKDFPAPYVLPGGRPHTTEELQLAGVCR